MPTKYPHTPGGGGGGGCGTVLFYLAVRQTDDFTHEWRAFGWETVKSLSAHISLPKTLSLLDQPKLSPL